MNKNKLFLVLILINVISFIGVLESFAQDNYPYKIGKGEKKVLEPKSFDVWVLKSSQFDKALADSKSLDLYKKQVEQLEKKIELTSKKDLEQDSLTQTLKKDRDYYKGIWKEADTDLTETAKKLKSEVKKKRFYRMTSFIGVGVIVLLLIL